MLLHHALFLMVARHQMRHALTVVDGNDTDEFNYRLSQAKHRRGTGHVTLGAQRRVRHRDHVATLADADPDVGAHPRLQEVQGYAADFMREYALELHFSPAAAAALVAMAERSGSGVREMCGRLFRDYSFGLKLIYNSTGQQRFSLDEVDVAEPDKWLSEAVRKSYRTEDAVGA